MKNRWEIFFELLQVAIGKRYCLSVTPTDEEWLFLYEIAKQQSLLGLLFYGIQKDGANKPERTLLLKWYSMSEKIKKGNQKANKVLVELTHFLCNNGFRTCVLKGQGNSVNYPNPYIRTSGDIDIWMEGGYKKVLPWARQFVGNAKFCYHHIEFKKINGIETELHYRPSFMNNPIHNRKIQKWFEFVADEQFTHEKELPDGVGKACIPTNSFNRIYQISHISNHFFYEGIGLRQIVDYYFILCQGFTEEERLHDEKLLKKFGLYKIASAVMFILKEFLNLDPNLMLVPADDKLGKFLLNEILQAGNFGQYDKRMTHKQGKLTKNLLRLKRDIRLMCYFPSECLWEPIFRWYHFFWRLCN